MIFSEFIKSVQSMIDNKQISHTWGRVDSNTFALNFGLSVYWDQEFSERVKQYFITSWICTDTRVGLSVYTLDSQIIAVSHKSARKNNENIDFISVEAKSQMFDLLASLLKKDLLKDQLHVPDSIDDSWFTATDDSKKIGIKYTLTI